MNVLLLSPYSIRNGGGSIPSADLIIDRPYFIAMSIWFESHSVAVELCMKMLVILLYESDLKREHQNSEVKLSTSLLVLGRAPTEAI